MDFAFLIILVVGMVCIAYIHHNVEKVVPKEMKNAFSLLCITLLLYGISCGIGLAGVFKHFIKG